MTILMYKQFGIRNAMIISKLTTFMSDKCLKTLPGINNTNENNNNFSKVSSTSSLNYNEVTFSFGKRNASHNLNSANSFFNAYSKCPLIKIMYDKINDLFHLHLKNFKNRPPEWCLDSNTFFTNRLDKINKISFCGSKTKSKDFSRYKSRLDQLYASNEVQKLLQKDIIDDDEIKMLAQLDGEHFDQLNTLFRNKYVENLLTELALNANDLSIFTKTDKKSFSRLISLLQNKTILNLIKNFTCSTADICLLATLDEEKFEQLNRILQNDKISQMIDNFSISAQDLRDFAQLDESNFEQLLSLVQNEKICKFLDDDKFKSSDLYSIASLNEQEFQKFESLIQDSKILELIESSSISSCNLEDYASYNEERTARLNSLIQNDGITKLLKKSVINGFDLAYFSEFDEKIFEQLSRLLFDPNFLDLFSNSLVDSFDLEQFLMLDDERFDKFCLLITDNDIKNKIKESIITTNDLYSFLQLNTSQLENLRALLQNDFIKKYLIQGCIDAEQVSNFAKIRQPNSEQLYALFENESINMLLGNFEINGNDLSYYASFNDKKFKRFSLLLNKKGIKRIIENRRMDRNDLKTLSNLNKAHFALLDTLLQNKCINEFIKNKKLGSYDLSVFAQQTKAEYEKMMSLLENEIIKDFIFAGKISSYDLYNFIQLNNEQIEKLYCLISNLDIQKLVANHILSGDNLYDLAHLNAKQEMTLNSLLQNKNIKEWIYTNRLGGYTLYNLCRLNSEQLDQLYTLLDNSIFKKLLTKGDIGENTLYTLARLNKQKFSFMNSLFKRKGAAQLRTKSIDEILQICNFLYGTTNSAKLQNLLKFNDHLKVASFTNKISLLTHINNVRNLFSIPNLFNKDEIQTINTFYDLASNSLKRTITPTHVTSLDIKDMSRDFFANNNPSLENLIKNANFKQYGTKGLPLSYSRESFLNDLSKCFENMTIEEQYGILQKMGISLVKNEYNNIIGYNGIIDLTQLKNTGDEGRILTIANQFIKGNSVKTADAELNKTLNSLIKGMPEFVNVIGKKQHKTQNFSVDIHILTVLQNALSNKDYKKLSNKDKTCLKYATILHDIAKSEGIVDKEHPKNSALFARNIMEKYPFNSDITDRVFELINNHHWLEKYNNGDISADHTASLFRHKDDYTIAKIMADADLRGVSDAFYNMHSYALNDENQLPIIKALENINSGGNLIYTSKVIKKDLIPKVKFNGYTYKVIDFTKMTGDNNLSEYGFTTDTTYDNARFFVHMTDGNDSLKAVDCLSDIANSGFLCTSYVSPKICQTYYNKRFGVSLEAENVNIANAASENQSSGGHKGFADFVTIIAGKDMRLSRYRQTLPLLLKKQLMLSNEEYIELYQMLASLKHLSQIQEDKVYKIGTKSIKGDKIKAAIVSSNDSLFGDNSQNEINLYNPKINAIVAKVDDIKYIAPYFLEFARENDLPIYLFGDTP